MCELSPARLIALKDGLSPYVSPMVCGDIVGPQSFFGESAAIPRPLRNLGKGDFQLADSSFAFEAHNKSVVLWEGAEGSPCSVDTTTFLAGACTSTFDVAWQLYGHGMLSPWTSVLSISQYEGRGQMRKRWHSDRGNLLVSFMLPANPIFSSDAGALAVAMLVAKAFATCGYDLLLKWPNDLVSRDNKKIGGILLEERNGVLIAGLGVNLENPPRGIEHEVSGYLAPAVLATASRHGEDEPPAPFFLWRSLVSQTILEYNRLVTGKALAAILAEADLLLAWKGRTVAVHGEEHTGLTGLCTGLGSHGGLCLTMPDGRRTEIYSGSVRLV